MGIKQHLMRLQWIGSNQKRPAMRQLDMGHLELDPFPANIGPVFTPIELEGFAWLEHQRDKSSAPGRLFRTMPIVTPCTSKGCNAFIGTIISQLHKISMHLLHCASLFA